MTVDIKSFTDVNTAVYQLGQFVHGLDNSRIEDVEKCILVYNEMVDIICDLETLIDTDAATRTAPDVDEPNVNTDNLN